MRLSDDIKVPLVIFGVVSLGFIALMVVGCTIEETYNNWKCNNWGEVTGNEVRYEVFDRCYTKLDGQWMGGSEYYARLAGTEAVKEFK